MSWCSAVVHVVGVWEISWWLQQFCSDEEYCCVLSSNIKITAGMESGGKLDKSVTSTLKLGKWLASRFSRFPPGEMAPGNHWVGAGTSVAQGHSQPPLQRVRTRTLADKTARTCSSPLKLTVEVSKEGYIQFVYVQLLVRCSWERVINLWRCMLRTQPILSVSMPRRSSKQSIYNISSVLLKSYTYWP